MYTANIQKTLVKSALPEFETKKASDGIIPKLLLCNNFGKRNGRLLLEYEFILILGECFFDEVLLFFVVGPGLNAYPPGPKNFSTKRL